MPKIRIKHEDETNDIEIKEGATVEFEDYVPEGFLSKEKVDRIVKERVNKTKESTKAELLEDESFKASLFEQHGLKYEDGSIKGVKTEADVEAIKKQIADRLAKEKDDEIQKANEQLHSISNRVIQSEIIAHAKGQIKDDLLTPVMGQVPIVNMLSGRYKIDEKGQASLVDKDGNFAIGSDGNNISIADDLKSLVQSDLKPFSKSSAQRGFFQSNGQSAGGDNPFSKDSWNLTKQSELLKENPELAKKLQSEASN